MAITITANNANGDGSGIDLTAYLGTFVSPNYSPIGFGYFSSSDSDFSGNQYAVTEQQNLIPDTSKQVIVFESGGSPNSIDYDFNTHIVGGDLDAISFGYGVTYNSGTDSFPLSQLDLRISGFGLVNQSGAGSTVEALLNDGRIGSITNLSNLLAANAIVFVGSTGVDTFTGFAQNDTVTGNGGNDTLGGGGGNDTALYTGNRADYTVTKNGNGTWTITDNRAGTPDGSDTLTAFEFAQFADQTIGLSNAAPAAVNDSVSTVKNLSTVIAVLDNDTDANGTLDPATVTVVDGPAHGTVTVNTTTGAITYKSALNYVGADSFTYTVKDNEGTISNVATVSLSVAAAHTLTEGDDVFSGDSLGLTTAGIEVNGLGGRDFIVTSNQASQPDAINAGDGDDLIFTGGGNDFVDAGAGDDVIHARGGIETLAGGTGTDTYAIRFFRNVASAATDTGTTTITDTDGVLWNGTFRSSGTLPSSWTNVPATAGFGINGTAAFVSPAVWDLAVTDDSAAIKHYALNWTGGDLTITAGTQTTIIKGYVSGTFGITLAGTTAANDSTTTLKNFARVIDVLANDRDSDGTLNAATVTIVDNPGHGTVSVNTSNGRITYMPTAEYTGADSFTYTVQDNNGNVSNKATVSLDVQYPYLLTAGDDVFSGDSLGWTTGSIAVNAGDGNDVVFGGASDDNLSGGNGNDTILGQAGNDTIGADAGDDRVNGGDGADVIFGGAGNDELGGGAGNDIIVGQDGNDVIFGEDGNDTANAGAGADVMVGGLGNDTFGGGADNDILVGGDGDDLLFGEDGFDNMNGEFGNDGVVGGSGDDILGGGAGNDIIVGDDGNDVLFGETGNDAMNGGFGNDILIGSDGDDVLGGGAGNDDLNGGFGNDTLFGENGNDILNGSAGNDILIGGGNDDVFVFAPGDGADTIGDFLPGGPEDRIWLAGTDLHALADVQSHATTVAGNTVITYNGFFTVTLNGVTAGQLTSGDFIFT